MADEALVPLVADRVPLNEVKFAARDYPSIFDDLLRRLKVVYGTVYNDFATTVQGIMLIEMMAYATGQLQWYLDRVASDCFLETARTSEAAGRIVRQLGYKMSPAVASSVDLEITFPDGTTGPFNMPERWRWRGPGGLQFETAAAIIEPVALPAGTVIQVALRQGETRTLTFTSTGLTNQSYPLTGIPTTRYLAHMSCEGWVDGLEWEERQFLTFAADEQFEVDYTSSPPRIQFGDGIAGLVPPLGATITVRFVVIDGIKGNQPKSGSITTSIDTLVIGGSAVSMTGNNPLAPSGGSDPETVDHARKLAPMSFAARGAAITEQDYEALSNSFADPLYGAVAKAYAFNPRGTYADLAFNDLVENVEDLLVAYVAAVGTLESDILSGTTDMADDLQLILDTLDDLETLRTDMETAAGSAKTSVQAAVASSVNAQAAASTAATTSQAQRTALEALYDYVDTNLAPSAEKTYIMDEITSSIARASTCTTQANNAQTEALASETAANDALAQINTLIEGITAVGVDPPDLSIPDIEATIRTAAEGMQTTSAALQSEALSMVGQAASLQADILLETAAMRARIAVLFSDDCMSNYVQVPILALDADGNYVAPSTGLMLSLQTYLDGVKEVTQQVEVVSGVPALVGVSIEIELRIIPVFVYEEEEAKVRAAVIALLKRRDFNSPLYLSNLFDTVLAASVGIDYVNIEITGPAAYLDLDGNLVPPANKIITLASGGLTITKLEA